MNAFAPATFARPVRATRLLVIRTRSRDFRESSFEELPRFFGPGDVFVVNDAATLPASLFGTARSQTIEVRLLALPDGRGECDAVLFGEGDWHTPTERRPAPPHLDVGDTLRLGDLEVTVVARTDDRRLRLRFARGHDPLIAAIYRAGRPVQYAHMKAPLALWDVQNVYASEPWAAEMPSAGRALDFALLDALRKRGVTIARLTHGAGLSSIGDQETDASLPWVERYRIPEETFEAVSRAKRVVAVGTSVVRALESARKAGEAATSLRIDARHQLRVARCLLTGMHDATTSHADLLAAFAPAELLAEASRWASAHGFLGHEMGDGELFLDD